MKIEKISDNQIRCTLDKEDLEEKDIKLSELAYGTEKAKELFRDMVEQAHDEFGFEVDNSPLMVEAIPIGDSQLVLVITKVDDPEELDARFSRFSKKTEESDSDIEQENSPQFTQDPPDVFDEIRIEGEIPLEAGEEATENLVNLLRGIIGKRLASMENKKKREIADEDAVTEADQEKTSVKKEEEKEDLLSEEDVDMEAPKEAKSVVFSFKSMTDVMKVAEMAAEFYDSTNTLFKDKRSGRYYLYVSSNRNTATEFLKLCNVMSEFGDPCRISYSTLDYFEEHFTTILRLDALQTIAEL